MTTLTIDDIKTYCRIDEDVDQELQELQQAAEAYIENAVDAKDKLNCDNKVYRLLVLMLVNHWYNNRDLVVIGTTTVDLPVGFRSLMQQLQSEAVGT